MKCLILSVFAVLTGSTNPCPGARQIPSATEAVARELLEIMLRGGGREAAEELAEMGGEAAVRQLLESAMSEGGDELVEQVAQCGARYGPAALKAVEPSPALMVRALDRVSPDLVEPAIRAAAREPEVTARLVAAYGKDALEVAAKHPGVGTKLAEKLGVDGIRAGQELTTDQAVTFARYADEVATLPPRERSQLLDAVTKAPTAVLDYLEKHPRVLLTAGGVVAVIAAKDNLLSRPIPSAGGGDPPPGFVERVTIRTLNRFTVPIAVVVAILALGILCRVVIWLRSAWKTHAIRLQFEEAQGAAETVRLSRDFPGSGR